MLLLGCNDTKKPEKNVVRYRSVRFEVEPMEPITVEIDGKVVATRQIPPLIIEQITAKQAHSYRILAEGYKTVTSTFVIDRVEEKQITITVRLVATESEQTAPVATCDGMCDHALKCVIERVNGSESQARNTQQYQDARSGCLSDCGGMRLEQIACWTAAPCGDIESEQLLDDQECPGLQLMAANNEPTAAKNAKLDLLREGVNALLEQGLARGDLIPLTEQVEALLGLVADNRKLEDYFPGFAAEVQAAGDEFDQKDAEKSLRAKYSPEVEYLLNLVEHGKYVRRFPVAFSYDFKSETWGTASSISPPMATQRPELFRHIKGHPKVEWYENDDDARQHKDVFKDLREVEVVYSSEYYRGAGGIYSSPDLLFIIVAFRYCTSTRCGQWIQDESAGLDAMLSSLTMEPDTTARLERARQRLDSSAKQVPNQRLQVSDGPLDRALFADLAGLPPIECFLGRFHALGELDLNCRNPAQVPRVDWLEAIIALNSFALLRGEPPPYAVTVDGVEMLSTPSWRLPTKEEWYLAKSTLGKKAEGLWWDECEAGRHMAFDLWKGEIRENCRWDSRLRLVRTAE